MLFWIVCNRMKVFDATNLAECDFSEIIMTEPTEKMKKRAAKANPKVEKPNDGAKVNTKTPDWYSLYTVLNDAGAAFLRSLTLREDIPEDAREIIRGVMCLRETKEMFFAEGERMKPVTALFWASELQKWAADAQKKIDSSKPE